MPVASGEAENGDKKVIMMQKDAAVKQQSAEKDNVNDGQSTQLQMFVTPKSPKHAKNKA